MGQTFNPLASLSYQSALPIQRYSSVNIWHWKSKVKVIGEFKSRYHTDGLATNRNTPFLCLLSRTNHSSDMAHRISNQDENIPNIENKIATKVLSRISPKFSLVRNMSVGDKPTDVVMIKWVLRDSLWGRGGEGGQSIYCFVLLTYTKLLCYFVGTILSTHKCWNSVMIHE